MVRRALLLLSLLIIVIPTLAQNKRPFTFEDMMKLKRIGDFTVSPDSKWVTFTAVDVDLEANTRKPHLWIVPVAGGEARLLTSAAEPGFSHLSADRLRFSPDGRHVLFTTEAKAGGSQIFVNDF